MSTIYGAGFVADIPAGETSGTVAEFTPLVGEDASAIRPSLRKKPLTEWVNWVEAALDCGFVLDDAILLQHARDLTQLMEAAWERFLDDQSDELHDAFLCRLRQRDATRRLLSPLQYDPGEFPF